MDYSGPRMLETRLITTEGDHGRVTDLVQVIDSDIIENQNASMLHKDTIYI